MKTIKWLLFGAWVISLTIIIFKVTDPFGLIFWMPFYAFLVISSALLTWLAAFLTRGKKVWLRLFCLPPLLIAIVLFVVTVVSLLDYRWLLPGFPNSSPDAADWKSDYESLKVEMKNHPALKDSLNQT